MDAVINDLNFINYIFNSCNLIGSIFIYSLNGLIMYVLLKKLKQDSIELKFIFFLCIIELIIGVDYFTLSIFKLYYGHTFFAPNNMACSVYSFYSSWFVRLEFIVVTVLALWRYLIVAHEIQISLKTLVVCTVLGMLPTAVLLIYGVVSMDTRPSASYILCSPISASGQASTIYNITFTILLLIPCWIITYCYSVIGWKANKKLNLMALEAQSDNNEVALKTIRSQKIRLMLQLLMVFILYNVDIMISVITYFMRLTIGYKRSPFFDAVIYEMGFSVIVFNPIVTVSFQPEVNNEIIFLLVKFNAKVKKLFKNLIIRQ